MKKHLKRMLAMSLALATVLTVSAGTAVSGSASSQVKLEGYYTIGINSESDLYYSQNRENAHL